MYPNEKENIEMRTALIIIDLNYDKVRYAILEGDFSELNGIHLKNYTTDYAKRHKLYNLIYDGRGAYSIKFSQLHDFCAAVRESAIVIECGI